MHALLVSQFHGDRVLIRIEVHLAPSGFRRPAGTRTRIDLAQVAVFTDASGLGQKVGQLPRHCFRLLLGQEVAAIGYHPASHMRRNGL